MSTRVRWMAVVAVVVVTILVAVFLWRGFRPAPAPPEIPSFTQDNVTVTSPDLAVSEALVRGTVHPGYTGWVCLLECLEPEGCRTDLRIGRVQRSPVEVEGIDKVTIEVRKSYREGGPEPTPIR